MPNKHITVDNIDIPNQRDRLPDWFDSQRKSDRARNVSPNLLIAALIIGCIAIITIAVIAVLWYREVRQNDPGFAQLVINGGFALLVIGIVLLLFAHIRKLNSAADVSSIVRLENDMPIPVELLRDRRRFAQLLDLAAMSQQRYYDTQTVWAEHSNQRNMNTFSPSYHYTNKQDGLTPGEELPLLPEPIQFSEGKTKIEQLRERGHVCRSGNSLMVGYDETQTPQYIEMQNTSFIAVAGMPRVGKTSSVKFLLSQAAMMGWHIAICDPHGKQEQGLLNLCQPISGAFIRQAIEPDEIVEAINFIDKIGRRRMSGDLIDRPVLLVIDEFTKLVLRDELPSDVLARLAAMVVEYSKVKIHGVIIGHDWTGKLLGTNLGTPLRRAITHRIVHRSDVQNAEFLLPNSTLAKQVTALEKGRALFWGDDNPITVGVPWIGAEDLRFAGNGLAPKLYQRRLPILPPTQSLTGKQVSTQSLPPITQKEIIIDLLKHTGSKLTHREIADSTTIADDVLYKLLNELTKERKVRRHGSPRNYTYSA